MNTVILNPLLDVVGERDTQGRRIVTFETRPQGLAYRLSDGSWTTQPQLAKLEGAMAHDSDVVEELPNQPLYIDSRNFPEGLVNFNAQRDLAPGSRLFRQLIYRVYTNTCGVKRGEAHAVNLHLWVAYHDQRQRWEVVGYEPR